MHVRAITMAQRDFEAARKKSRKDVVPRVVLTLGSAPFIVGLLTHVDTGGNFLILKRDKDDLSVDVEKISTFYFEEAPRPASMPRNAEPFSDDDDSEAMLV